jgi:RecA-family ATPase
MEATAFEIGELRLPTAEPTLRPPVVDGLFRRGEVCNWIAAPKTGKTWMLYSLIAAIIRGKRWCGFPCTPGKVLLVDNELHPETGLARLWRVMHQAGISADEVAASVDVAWIRGRRGTLEDLEATVRSKPRGTYSLIALDAFYRFIGRGLDENSNSDMTSVYNHLDGVARYAEAAILNVHHASKGVQSGRETMDIGAGAGAIGRATDSHVVFLRHQEDDCVIMRARCRSFRQPRPIGIRIDFSTSRVWHDEDIDVDDEWQPPKPKKKPS